MLNSVYTDEEIQKKKFKKPDPVKEPDFVEPNLKNPLYKGNYADPENQPASKANDSLDDDVEEAFKNKGLIGGSGDYMGTASQAISLAGNVMARENSEPMGKKESTMSALSMGASAAALGASVGGPWGAAIGFVAGTGYGLIKGGSDAKKILKRKQRAQTEFLSKTTKEREAAQRLSDGNYEIQKSKNLLQNQMGLIGSQYLNNQNS